MKLIEVKSEKKATYKPITILDKTMEEKDNKSKEDLPSAADDSADVTSRYEKYKKSKEKSQFPPIDYEKPPHH